MTQEQAPDYAHLPPSVPADERIAHQAEVDERYGGAGGGGDVVGMGALDGADGD